MGPEDLKELSLGVSTSRDQRRPELPTGSGPVVVNGEVSGLPCYTKTRAGYEDHGTTERRKAGRVTVGGPRRHPEGVRESGVRPWTVSDPPRRPPRLWYQQLALLGLQYRVRAEVLQVRLAHPRVEEPLQKLLLQGIREQTSSCLYLRDPPLPFGV